MADNSILIFTVQRFLDLNMSNGYDLADIMNGYIKWKYGESPYQIVFIEEAQSEFENIEFSEHKNFLVRTKTSNSFVFEFDEVKEVLDTEKIAEWMISDDFDVEDEWTYEYWNYLLGKPSRYYTTEDGGAFLNDEVIEEEYSVVKEDI